MSKINDNSQAIGNTPLIPLKRVSKGRVLAKIESQNPSFSIKCRICANMVLEAEKDQILRQGKELIEPTSGNTGIALACIAAARGYDLTLTMPESVSLEKRKSLKALGAKLILTEASKGLKGAIEKAEEIAESNLEHYVLLHQFDNPANPKIHEKTTGPEIWQATQGNIDVLVAGVGTGGTITGISRFIKHHKCKEITTVAVEPTETSVIFQTLVGEKLAQAPHAMQGIGIGFLPGNLDLSIIDRVEDVSSDEAITMAQRLMKEEGILAGISSGAAVVAASRVADLPEYADKTIVVILPCAGENYASSGLFTDCFDDE